MTSNLLQLSLHICTLCWHTWSDKVKSASLPFLIAILRLSMQWLFPIGCDFALKTLPSHLEFTPFLHLQLAHKFQIWEWVEPAFCTPINQPLESICLIQETQMGNMPYYILSQMKWLIDAHLHGFAFMPPPVLSEFPCISPEMCEEAAWWAGFAKHILHPDCPHSNPNAMRVLNDIQITRMCKYCLCSIVDSVWEVGPFEEIELVICEDISKVVKWVAGEEVKRAYLQAQEVKMQMQMC